jgi:phosphatidylserine decarboxylase precursor
MEEFIGLGIKAQKYLPDVLSTAFTRKICTSLGKSKSPSLKKRFAKTYKIDWKQARKCKKAKSLEACLNKFTDLNDLFARKIDPELTEPEKTGKNHIVSPAQSHVRKVQASSTFKIKGAKYTLKQLLDTDQAPTKATVFIFRLAPDQYHRFHSPTDSVVTSIREVSGAYKSVNPILLNSVPVLQQNYRKLVSFENGIQMAIVGATCVGSVKLSVKVGDSVKQGTDMGTFEFGGSCIALVIPYKLKSVLKTITANEKVLEPGTWVCTF